MICLSAAMLWACSGDDRGGDKPRADAGHDASVHTGDLDGGWKDPTMNVDACVQHALAFTTFLAQHSSCSQDSDCTIVGDCGPYADFAAVSRDASAAARQLQLAMCPTGWDGPTYQAVCNQGTCTRAAAGCCGCATHNDGGL